MRSSGLAVYLAATGGLVIAVALSALAPARAGAQIIQPGTQPTGHEGGLVTPVQTSSTCKRCHAGYDDADDYEPYESCAAR